MTTVVFSPYGPFRIPVSVNANRARIVDGSAIGMLKSYMAAVGSAPGLYVFAMRSGGGMMPWYVGMARAQSLRDEAFTPDKLNKLNAMLHASAKGTPVVLFCAADGAKLPANRLVEGVIDELEDVLIYEARCKNPKLINRRKGHGPQWQIQGVWRSGPGKRSAAAKAFAKALW